MSPLVGPGSRRRVVPFLDDDGGGAAEVPTSTLDREGRSCGAVRYDTLLPASHIPTPLPFFAQGRQTRPSPVGYGYSGSVKGSSSSFVVRGTTARHDLAYNLIIRSRRSLLNLLKTKNVIEGVLYIWTECPVVS